VKTKRQQLAEFQAILDRARRNEASAPRKHHVVPASYLRRWAEENRVRVTEVDTGTSYETSPLKAARITDFYRIEAEGLDPDEIPPLLIETALAEIEGWGRGIIDELISQPESLDPRQIANFAWFLAFQFTRGMANREEMRFIANDFFKIRYTNLSDDGIRRELRRRGAKPTPELVEASRRLLDQVRDGKVMIAPQDAALVGHAAQSAAAAGEHFLYRAWIVCRTPRILVTCDEPVVAVGGPGSRRGERAGVASAGVLLFPLSPDRLLVMMRDDLALAHGIAAHRDGRLLADELDHIETAEICREIVMNSHRWAFERPSRRVTLQFEISPSPGPAASEEVGPIRESNREGYLMRTFRPSRWMNRSGPSPWPVARWWAPDLS
jgi:hypothetical protein